MAHRPLVFFSYVSEDFKKVAAYREYVERRRYFVWLDKEDLLAGRPWAADIDQNIRIADHVVIFLSRHVANMPDSYCHRERKLALSLMASKSKPDGYVIPVLLDKCIIPP